MQNGKDIAHVVPTGRRMTRQTRSRRRVRAIVLAASSAALASSSLGAVTETWLSSAPNNTWNTNGGASYTVDWSNGVVPGAPSNSNDDTAVFNTAITNGTGLIKVIGNTYGANIADLLFDTNAGSFNVTSEGSSGWFDQAGTSGSSSIQLLSSMTTSSTETVSGLIYGYNPFYAVNNSSAGTLTIAGGFSSGKANFALNLGGSNTNANTVSAAIGGGNDYVTLNKYGAGTWVLGGTGGTYISATNVSAGTLLVDNTAGSGTGTGSIAVFGGSSNYGGAMLGGTGSVTGTVTLSASTTAKQGGQVTAGKSYTTAGTSLATTTGKFTTGGETWNNGAVYKWGIAATGNAGQTVGSGGSGTTGSSTTWDDVSMSSLNLLNAGGSHSSFTIDAVNTATLSGSAGQYSWIIAQVTGGAPTLPTGVTAASTTSGVSTGNLLTQAPSSGSNDLFALDTTGLTINGVTNPSPSNFSLEFVGTGSGDNLVLDYSATPEPGTMLLVLGGVTPLLVGRRRRQKMDEHQQLID